MKGISLWQPWASALALGSKLFETRGWQTKYRGELAIQAAQMRRDATALINTKPWRGALHEMTLDAMPFGEIVCVATLIDCVPTETIKLEGADETPPLDYIDHSWESPWVEREGGGKSRQNYSWMESEMGDFSDGRFAWVFDNVRMLSTPLPFKASQGLFNVPDDIRSLLASQIEIR